MLILFFYYFKKKNEENCFQNIKQPQYIPLKERARIAIQHKIPLNCLLLFVIN